MRGRGLAGTGAEGGEGAVTSSRDRKAKYERRNVNRQKRKIRNGGTTNKRGVDKSMYVIGYA